jgi:MFS family permease
MGIIRQLFVRFLPGAGLNRSLRILIALNVVFTFIVGVFAPFYAIFVQNIGGTVAFAGISWGLFTIVSGVLMLLFVRWELRVREQELLLALGYFLRAIVFVSYAYMASIPQLLLTQVLWGVAAAIGVPAFAALYSEHTSKERSIGEWGGLEGLSSIASGVAALSGGFIIQIFGFQAMFFGMAGVSVALALYIWLLPREAL